MEKVYCISATGTVFEHPEVLERKGIKEVLCLCVIGGLYYCPDLGVVFCRHEHDGKIEYSWDNACFPDYDEDWKGIQHNPFWRQGICRIDAPIQKSVTDNDL